MAGYKNFQVDRLKYNHIYNIYHPDSLSFRKKDSNLDKNKVLYEGFKKWISYWRARPHRFVEDYLGIKLKFFQKVWLYAMFHFNFVMLIGSRGLSKSFMTALCACCKCILYSNLKVGVASGKKGQARLIVDKVEELARMSPALKREIVDIKNNKDEACVIFQGGSTIKIVTSNENARGHRFHMMIFDEFRQIDKDILDSVLRPFLNVKRQIKGTSVPEENQEIYISSAYYKSSYMWERFKSFLANMVNGKSYFVCALPYQLAIEEGLLSMERIQAIKEEEDFDPIIFAMEYETLFWGVSDKAYYRLEDIQACRKLKKCEMKAEDKNATYIMGVDVARVEGDENDNTCITIFKLQPRKDGTYTKNLVYIETMHGEHFQKQALRIRHLAEDFMVSKIVLDTNGNGIGLYDWLSVPIYDEERDKHYPAWIAENDEREMSQTYKDKAVPIIYSVKSTSLQLNHEMYVNLQNQLQSRKLRLLVDEIEGEDFITSKYPKLSNDEKAAMLASYYQTSALVNEMLNLEYETKGGYIRLKPASKTIRKDRFTSVLYACWYIKLLEDEQRKKENTDDYAWVLY